MFSHNRTSGPFEDATDHQCITQTRASEHRFGLAVEGVLWLGPEADLYYRRARWYEPGTGRFLRKVPFGLSEGVNPYT